MPRSLFELPARVAVACSNCRDRKVKVCRRHPAAATILMGSSQCIHESQQTACMRCQFNGLLCQYVATERQQERSRKSQSKPVKRNSTRKSPPAISVQRPSRNITTQGSQSPSGNSMDGFLPSGWSDTTSPSPTTQYEFPTALTPSLHILPEGTDYWLPDHPPSPYHTPIYISKRRAGPPDIASDIQPEMYFTPPSFGFDIPTLYPINYEDYGWHGSSQMCQRYVSPFEHLCVFSHSHVQLLCLHRRQPMFLAL
jgi:hypothetical protein